MLTPKKILAITGDPALISILETGLAPDGYGVFGTSHSGTELKYTIEYEHPDFIVQDIIMPSLDGIGYCLQIRQWTQTPIIMLTTWETGDNTLRGLDLNAANFLTEPFNIEILKLRIREMLKRNSIAASSEIHPAQQKFFWM